MHRIRTGWFTIALLLVALGSAVPAWTAARGFQGKVLRIAADDLRLPQEPFVVRVYYDSVDAIGELQRFDLLEFNDREERYVLLLVDRADYAALLAEGWSAGIDVARTAALHPPLSSVPARAGIAGYPCYRTVEETFASAQALVAAQPGLASWVDVGDSWKKSQSAAGYDLNVLKITNSAIPGPKPVLFLTAALHGREYTTAELATRFAEELLLGYGQEPDATWLVDHHEIHLLLVANPDARKMAESGLLWRKNTNTNYCSPGSNDRGADLDRNFDFQWGCCGGGSAAECAPLYRGPAAASEPETQAVQAYLQSVFADQRGPLPTDPAPASTTGVYVDIHSYSELVSWPWGSAGVAPNGTELTTLGRRLAFLNGYGALQAVDVVPSDGTAADFAYGELGVASFVVSLGTSFFQDCPTFESSIVSSNVAALLYAARVARTPYQLPGGPETAPPAALPAYFDPGDAIQIQAEIDDGRFAQGNGVEPTQAIAAAELYVDIPPWSPGATAIPMAAADGSFDAVAETATVTLDTTGWTGGKHLLFVRGQDALGNWGPVRARFVYVRQGTEGTVSGTVTEAGSGLPLAATIQIEPIGVTATSDPVTGVYSVDLPDGSWELTFMAANHLTQSFGAVPVSTGSDTTRDAQLVAIPPILVVDDDDNAPDVRAYYTDALDALGEAYTVWDTDNSDMEPDLNLLQPFEVVLWTSGAEFGGAAGPGSASATALGDWLDLGRCLLISGQDYFFDRGLTPFNQGYLGLASATSDVSQTTVTGQGSLFTGFGPYTLNFPYSNYSDRLTADGTAELAFSGSAGDAALSKDTGWYRTTYWGFGLEAVDAAADREALVARFLTWCGTLDQADADSDGTPNSADCAPQDGQVWAVPGLPTGLMLGQPARDDLLWTAPAMTGGPGVVYDLLRSGSPPDFATALCVESGGADLVAVDPAIPGPGALFLYRVRARNSCGESPVGAVACP